MSFEPRIYELRHTFASRTLQLSPWLTSVLIGSLALIVGDREPVPAFLWAFALLMGFGHWWFIARFPSRLAWDANGRIEASGFGLRVELDASEIESIQPSSQLGFLDVRYRGGRKLRLLNQLDGFHELVTRLEHANPRIDLHGC